MAPLDFAPERFGQSCPIENLDNDWEVALGECGLETRDLLRGVASAAHGEIEVGGFVRNSRGAAAISPHLRTSRVLGKNGEQGAANTGSQIKLCHW